MCATFMICGVYLPYRVTDHKTFNDNNWGKQVESCVLCTTADADVHDHLKLLLPSPAYVSNHELGGPCFLL